MRVSIDDLRPWEYDAMDADRYDEIVLLRGWFREGVEIARQMAHAQAEAIRALQR